MRHTYLLNPKCDAYFALLFTARDELYAYEMKHEPQVRTIYQVAKKVNEMCDRAWEIVSIKEETLGAEGARFWKESNLDVLLHEAVRHVRDWRWDERLDGMQVECACFGEVVGKNGWEEQDANEEGQEGDGEKEFEKREGKRNKARDREQGNGNSTDGLVGKLIGLWERMGQAERELEDAKSDLNRLLLEGGKILNPNKPSGSQKGASGHRTRD